jgi:hypothetical protein
MDCQCRLWFWRSFRRRKLRTREKCRLIFAVALVVAGTRFLRAQVVPGSEIAHSVSKPVCANQTHESAVHAALRLVCRQDPALPSESPLEPTIVIGFVGGFASPRDEKHPEVLFADYLREHYGAGMDAQVFSNHDEKGALRFVLHSLDSNHDGFVSAEERRQARIIIYGHSWGATETAVLARVLGQESIPVLLTIQVDIIPKFRQRPFRIPPNVGSAINFYQSEGFLQGEPEITASDPAHTTILGNLRFTYSHHRLNCDNYSWMARTFNKPHHEIENDPHVWDNIASLIDARISGERKQYAGVRASNGGSGYFSASEKANCCSETSIATRP